MYFRVEISTLKLTSAICNLRQSLYFIEVGLKVGCTTQKAEILDRIKGKEGGCLLVLPLSLPVSWQP
jgi:hypothetical protein